MEYAIIDRSNVQEGTTQDIVEKVEVAGGMDAGMQEGIGIRLIDTGKTLKSKVRSSEDSIRESLEKFYNNDLETFKMFVSAIFTDKGNKVTYASETARRQLGDFVVADFPALRTFEWFLTNYCDKHDISYFLKVGENQFKHFFVHRTYKALLDSYKKTFFDPFSRKGKIVMVDPFGNRIQTTLAQLNFFKWNVKNGIIHYVLAHREEIEEDLRQSKLEKKRKRKGEADAPAVEEVGATLEIKASKRVTTHNVTIVVDFKSK